MYLFVGIAVITVMLLLKFFGEKNGLNRRNNPTRWIFVVVLWSLGIVAMNTISKYMYPEDEEIFSNLEYHLLEHRGFRIDNNTFDLVNNTFTDGSDPEKSLWDNKIGHVAITKKTEGAVIDISDYYEPFFVSRNDGKSKYFVYPNRTCQADASKGFELTREGKCLYRMEITPYKKDGVQRCRYVSVVTGKDSVYRYESTFNRVIRKGYPLCDIIASTPGFTFTEDLYNLLQGTLLVREKIQISNSKYGAESSSADIDDIDLVVVPGQTWYYDNSDVLVDGIALDKSKFTVDFDRSCMFYSGIGRSKTDVYSVRFAEDGTMELRYALQKMQRFSKDHSHVFLTSSVNTVLANPSCSSKDSTTEGGYYYNILELDGNKYHINAEMRYWKGTSREKLGVEVMDMYSENPSDKPRVKIGNEFELSTLSKDVKWIFAVRDLRAENPLGWSYIMMIITVFILIVFLRICADSFFQLSSLSYLEMSIYIVLLCMVTVRLVLAWRTSTFVPIEDVTGPVFDAMRDGKTGWAPMIWAYPGVLLLWTLVKGIQWSGLREKVRIPVLGKLFSRIVESFSAAKAYVEQKCLTNELWNLFFGPKMRVCVLFFSGIVTCFIGSHLISSFNRLLNIPGPMVLYILCELWIASMESKSDTDIIWPRIVNGIILSGYLFMADAGFIVILLVYFILLHGIICPLTDGLYGLRGSTFKKLLVSIISLAAVFAMLKYEGKIMIFMFENIRWISKFVLAALFFALTPFVFWVLRKSAFNHYAVTYRTPMLVACILVSLLGLLMTNWLGNAVSDEVEGKSHMRWRAEVQKLDESKNETIDDLMLKSEFNSSDIEYIMRSAHNQWFINQYFKEGDNVTPQKYFILQEHSNQGSTFTTQTTDLAITRYVTAEHGHWPARWMLVLYLLLIAIYCFEIRFKDEDGKQDRVLLGPLVLIFTLALMVYLSATNRIVFIGQDFPLVSIQSKVAVIFPVILLLLATFPVMVDRMNDEKGIDGRKLMLQKRVIPILLLVFYGLTVWVIKPLGISKDDTKFDVSAIIQQLSANVGVIDKDFERYQRINDFVDMPREILWEKFKDDRKFSQNLTSAMKSDADSLRFFASLLNYFDSEQKDKDNPDELLHMRKRNGIWHLTVNKKHFFIPSKKSVADMWRGDVYAARIHQEYSFTDVKGNARNNSKLDPSKPYESNIIPSHLRNRVQNVQIVKFDNEWIPDSNEPLILVKSNIAKGSKQYYHIESAQGSIKGSESSNQFATRVKRGDVIILNTTDTRGLAEEVVSWKYDVEPDRYFAKNIWLNGRNRLFYPLGKDFIWSYQFANMVSSIYSKDEQYRDSSIRLTLDYELHKKFNNILSSSNKTKSRSLSQSTLNDLLRFAQNPMGANNMSSFYYDSTAGQVKCRNASNNASVTDVLRRINRNIAREIANDPSAQSDRFVISEAVYQATERLYEFTAVAIDGDGKIRLMFDHGKKHVVDPNNISNFNKFLSELYRAGDNSSERDVFGNKALQILPSGPGSSFKPIMYTSVTSGQKLAWETINVSTDWQAQARHVPQAGESSSGNATYDYYGGIELQSVGELPLSIASGNGLAHNNYLIHSNNLYHSVIVLLGMQKAGCQTDIMKQAGTGPLAFPVFTYQGKKMSFNPSKWHPIDVYSGMLNIGLNQNFGLMELMPAQDTLYTNHFGVSNQAARLFKDAGNYRNWVFTETGSQNVPDRALSPYVRNGFNQLLLGASPLEVSPLQMCTMAMRLATLNKSPNITTLIDDPSFKPKYEFFFTNGWDNDQEYFSFYKRQVLAQMRQVPKDGTARGLRGKVGKWESKGYYIYAKTGTLNDGRSGHSANSRMKHLLVIISNKPLESVSSIQELKDVKYYALYLSCIGIDKNSFSNSIYAPMIDAVIESELFENYMKK